jgi:hypothetical protein
MLVNDFTYDHPFLTIETAAENPGGFFFSLKQSSPSSGDPRSRYYRPGASGGAADHRPIDAQS